jgi:hypothetical protein
MVIVKALATLPAKPTGGDVFAEKRAGAKLAIAELSEQDLHDRQDGVIADQV